MLAPAAAGDVAAHDDDAGAVGSRRDLGRASGSGAARCQAAEPGGQRRSSAPTASAPDHPACVAASSPRRRRRSSRPKRERLPRCRDRRRADDSRRRPVLGGRHVVEPAGRRSARCSPSRAGTRQSKIVWVSRRRSRTWAGGPAPIHWIRWSCHCQTGRRLTRRQTRLRAPGSARSGTATRAKRSRFRYAAGERSLRCTPRGPMRR